jgi:Epoxide hydrolase N terminus
MRAREKSEIVNHERRQLLTAATMGLVAAGTASLLVTYRAQAATGEAREAIRPFHIHFPEKDLVDLRHRLAATRWPEKETVDDDTQGVPLATMRELVRHWQTDYDWRKIEARLNALPQFITEIDGLDIHFIHVRSKHENALPLIVTHGWLGHRAVEDHRSLDQSYGAWGQRIGRVPSGDPVVAGLRLFRQANRDRLGSGAHRAGLDRVNEAARLCPFCCAGWRLGLADLP